MDKEVVLVTGGAGYIGSHVCKMLHEFGYMPIVYDNLSYGHKEFAKWGPLEVGDIQDTKKLCTIFKKYKPTAVLHFAAFALVAESVFEPSKYYKNNLGGTISLLDAMRFSGIQNIIFSSTCAIFGIPTKIPLSENLNEKPINPYGRSKLFIEKVMQDYEYAYGIKNICLRYFNAAGADPEGQIGEDHNPETHIIPLALDVALGRKKEIIILGDDYPTHDGTCVRDYIHVQDLALAHVLALSYLKSKNKSNAFNLGTGKGFSVKEILNAVEKITGKKLNIKNGERRKGDPPILISDPTKSINELGWKSQYTKIDQIILHAWNWHKKRFSEIGLNEKYHSCLVQNQRN